MGMIRNLHGLLSDRLWLMTDNIFQHWFGKHASFGNPEAGDGKFRDLYHASISFGAIAYRIVFALVLYACVITLIMHLAKLVLSLNPQATAEAKGKVMRCFMVALFCGGIVSIIALIVVAFAV